MREWDFWMWLAYGLIAIAATFSAVDQGIKLAPELAEQLSWLTNRNWWAFSPLAFVITATIVFLLHDFGVIGSTRFTQQASQFINWKNTYTPVSVTWKTFKNQIVDLDGISYSECNFHNVTFRYNGTTPIRLINNIIYGSISHTSDNPSINDTFLMLRGVGMLFDDVYAEVTPR